MNRIELIDGFRCLGVQCGMSLEVHCSLGSFEYIKGGADALIEALMEAVGNDGAIVMPSFSISENLPLTDDDKRLGLALKCKLLNENDHDTNNGMGIVANTFQGRTDTITGQGIFRVSAWGKDAELHAASGFRRIIDSDGCALLLGVDIYRLSAMHYVEDLQPEEIRMKFAPSDEARAKYPENQWLIEAWSPETKPWYQIQKSAYQEGLIKDRIIGNAKCMFFKVRPVVELYRKALLERPFELYGIHTGER